MSARPLPVPINPALLKHADQRRQSLENRIADQITRFAGSMLFVYLHIVWFAAWILLGVEHYPYGLLTMIVSLEAIFLSTFVMISQNRADEKRQVLADHGSCPTRSCNSPGPSRRGTSPGRPPAGTAPSRCGSTPKEVA